MTNPLNSMVHTRLEAVITKLSEYGVTDEHGEAILKNPEFVMTIVAALDAKLGLTRSFGRSLGIISLKAQTPDEIIVELKVGGYEVSPWAKDLISRMPAVVACDLELVVVTVRELGFTSDTRLDKIVARAQARFGLELCPAGVGPALRMALKNQPMDEWLVIAMKPITVSVGVSRVFRVDRDSDGLWLETHYGRAGYQFAPGASLVFVRGKQPSVI
jgi:hypothetical protein